MAQIVGADGYLDLLFNDDPKQVKKAFSQLPEEDKKAVVAAGGADPEASVDEQAKEIAKASPEEKGLMYKVLLGLQANKQQAIDAASSNIIPPSMSANKMGTGSIDPTKFQVAHPTLDRGSVSPSAFPTVAPGTAEALVTGGMPAKPSIVKELAATYKAPAAAPTASAAPVAPAAPAQGQSTAAAVSAGTSTATTKVGSKYKNKAAEVDNPARDQKDPVSEDGLPGGQGTIAESLGFAQNESQIDKDLQSGLSELARTRGVIALIQGLGTLAAGFYGLHKGIDMSSVMQAKVPQFEAEEKALLERAKFRREQLVRDQEQTARKGELAQEQALRREGFANQKAISDADNATRLEVERLRAANDKELESIRNANNVKLELAKNRFAKSQSIGDAMKTNSATESKLRTDFMMALKAADKADDPDAARQAAMDIVISTAAGANPDMADELVSVRDKAVTDPVAFGFGGGDPDPSKLFSALKKVAGNRQLYWDRTARDVLEGERSMQAGAPATGAAPTQATRPATSLPDGSSQAGRDMILTYMNSANQLPEVVSGKRPPMTEAIAEQKLIQFGRLQPR